MNRQISSRVLAAILLGAMLGWLVHSDSVKWKQLGREAFLADQSEKFDSTDADPTPLSVMLVVSSVLTLVLFGGYELLVLLIGAALKPLFPIDKTNIAASIPFT